MNLLVDVGNSRIKWATIDNADIHPGAAFGWKIDANRPPEVLEAEFARHWGRLESVSAVWAVNVGGGDIGDRISTWCRHAWNAAPRFVHSLPAAHGIVNGYRDPAQLGADRFVAMIGARRDHKEAFCVVDCGTALTVDAVNERGEFIGGMISPGLELMRRSLTSGTHALSYGERNDAESLPRDTGTAIAAGTLHALIGCIEHAVGSFRGELGRDPLCLLTGGEAAMALERLAIAYRYEPHLVLKGLAVIAEETL